MRRELKFRRLLRKHWSTLWRRCRQTSRLRGKMKTIICSIALLSFTFPAWAGHAFHVEDLQRVSRVDGPRVSPDGKWVAFTVSRSDVEKNRRVTNIWMIPASGGDPQQLTFGDQGFNGDQRWSPDSRYLYFVSTRVDNKRQIFRRPVTGGEAKQVTTVPTGVDAYVLSPDGKNIAITASVFPSCTDMACNEKMAKERADNPVKTRVITEMPFRRLDTWVDGMRNHRSGRRAARRKSRFLPTAAKFVFPALWRMRR